MYLRVYAETTTATATTPAAPAQEVTTSTPTYTGIVKIRTDNTTMSVDALNPMGIFKGIVSVLILALDITHPAKFDTDSAPKT